MRWERVLGNTGVIYTDYALIPTCRISDREVVLIDSGAQPHPELLEDLAREGLTVPAPEDADLDLLESPYERELDGILAALPGQAGPAAADPHSCSAERMQSSSRALR